MQLEGYGLTLAPLERWARTDEGIRRVFEAFRGGDPRALFEVIAEDAVWLVNGTVPVAQEYRGRDPDLRALPRDAPAHRRHVPERRCAGRLPATSMPSPSTARSGERLGRELDIDQVLLIDHEDGVWQRIVAIPTDPPAFEAFWAA